MADPEDNPSISPEEYGTLMEKLGKVEEMLEKAPTEIKAIRKDIEDLTKKVDSVEKAAGEDKSTSAEDVKELIKEAGVSIIERLDVIEKTPFMKGVQDFDLKKMAQGTQPEDKPEEKDVMNDIFKSAYNGGG